MTQNTPDEYCAEMLAKLIDASNAAPAFVTCSADDAIAWLATLGSDSQPEQPERR